MRLILQSLRKNGAGFARFYGLNYAPAMLRQFPHNLSSREELSTASKFSRSQSSRLEKKPYVSSGSAPPPASPGSGNQLKLLLGGGAVLAVIAVLVSLPSIRSKREQASILDETEQSDAKVSEVIGNGDLKDEDSTHSKEDVISSNLSHKKEQVKEEMKQSYESHETRPGQEESDGMLKEKKIEDSEIHKEQEVDSTSESMSGFSNENGQVDSTSESVSGFSNENGQEVKNTESSNNIEDDTSLHVENGISKQEILSEVDSGMKNSDVKETYENTDGSQELGAGGLQSDRMDSEIRVEPYHDVIASEVLKQDAASEDQQPLDTDSDTDFLPKGHGHKSQGVSSMEDHSESKSVSELKEDAKEGIESIKEKDISKDGSLVLNFIEAIHAAEQRQADLDAHIYAEYKQKLKEKYEKELKDARARELMYAEEADSLEKELNKEREKANATIKSLDEKAEEQLKSELRRKEEETGMKLKKAQLLAKAETSAAIAKEKSSYLNDMADANLQINALRMAFYARSEEARQSHSLHKLALGTFALEDALMKGAPFDKEIAVLRASMEGIDKDVLLDVALASLPPETLTHGTKTEAQLHQTFESLKGTLRELALIPAGGGGLLTHALAHFASAMKVKEDGLHSEGIESVIAHAEQFLAEGKLIEAADALEKGAQGSKAESLAAEWARQARNRAVTEQALSLLRAYAIAIASTLT